MVGCNKNAITFFILERDEIMKFKSIAARTGIALLTLSAIIGHSVANAETTLDRIKRTGEIRIGYANEAPFAYTLPDGRVTGESPEIVNVMSRKIGATKVNAVLTEWGGLIPGLQAGRFDVIAAGMYVTPARLKQVLFTDPHYQLGDTLLVAKGNPKKLNSYADIVKDPSVKLAVMSGSAELEYAKKAGILDNQILLVPDTIAQLQSVLTKRADAAVGTQLTMKGLAAKASDRADAIKTFADDPSHTGYGALAFRKEDKDLRDAFNKELQGWLGSPEHLKTVTPFGFDRDNLTKKKAQDFAE